MEPRGKYNMSILVFGISDVDNFPSFIHLARHSTSNTMASTTFLKGNGMANGYIHELGPAGSSLSVSTERIQIVNEEKNFTLVDLSFLMSASLTHLCRPDLAAQIDKWGLRDTGFAYNIVSVFGSQSTGKSK